MKGVDLRTVQELLGHKTLTLTLTLRLRTCRQHISLTQ